MTIEAGGELFGRVYEKGSVIFHQGEPGDAMYIIQSGVVEVSHLQDNKEIVLALFERGDFFGEMALLDEQTRSATVTAIHRTRLLSILRSSFMERVQQDPGVVLHLLKIICRRIDRTNDLLKKTVGGNASLRLMVRKSGQSCIEIAGEVSAGNMSAAWPPPPPAYSMMADGGDSVWYKAGQTVFRQGDYGDSMYLITEGLVDIVQGSETSEVVLASLGPGNFFGEMALIMDAPRTATALATESTCLLKLSKDGFIGHMRKQPALALFIIQSLIRRLKSTVSFLSSPQQCLKSISSFPVSARRHNRLKVAIVSLSTCGGCTTGLVDEQQDLYALLERARVSYCPMLMDKGNLDDCDIAIVDGVVRLKEEEERLKEARQKSRYLVAWGTCATLGGVPALANQFEIEDLLEESYREAHDVFSLYLSGSRGGNLFRYQDNNLELLRKAGKIDDHVMVDYYLPGCPPQTRLLLHLMKELRNEPSVPSSKAVVCKECPRKTKKTEIESLSSFPDVDILEGVCFVSQGVMCMGFLTRGGCGAVCTSGGLPCWGCRGPSDATLKKIEQGERIEQVLADSLALRCHLEEGKIKSALRSMHAQANSVMNFYHNHVFDRTRIR